MTEEYAEAGELSSSECKSQGIGDPKSHDVIRCILTIPGGMKNKLNNEAREKGMDMSSCI